MPEHPPPALADDPDPSPTHAAVRTPDAITVGAARATMTLLEDGELRTYRLATTAELRGHQPPDQQITFAEAAGGPVIRTGDALFDGLYALALHEARANSVSHVSDGAYRSGEAFPVEAFEAGELWRYVWTRDLAYALDLGLAGFDPPRAVNSLLFKASAPKSAVHGGVRAQIVQDTGSGGGYPVSTDRVVWALGAHETLKSLDEPLRGEFLRKVYPILCGTIEQDRRLVFDPDDGLYRGEQSFLDWREQTYPGWTRQNVLAIAVSKALSVNAANVLLLTRAADYAGRLDQPGAQARYAQWAADLRAAINRRFWDAERGLYSTYLLSDDGVSDSVRVERYDLLGEALAILSGVADARPAASILEHYPTGPFGPPVVWPQERSVPIYHNQAVWPFVTAYWLRAARQTAHAAAVEAGIASLEQLAALNLSNLENADFASGRAEVRSGPRVGPQVNSRRQLWSVAAYLSMVQDTVFGRDVSWEGLRFRPGVTAGLRHGVFRAAETVEWRGWTFRGTRHLVRLHLPPAGSFARGICGVDRIELNGRTVGAGFVPVGELAATNEWNVYLEAPGPTATDSAPLRTVDTSDEVAYCAPLAPVWTADGQGGITLAGDRLALHFECNDPARTAVNIYRDGQLRAAAVHRTTWVDPDSADYRETVRSYRAASVDLRTGNVSHLTPARAYRTCGQTRVIAAQDFHGPGARLAAGHHFESWGEPGDELATAPLVVDQGGRYLVRAEFANGSGPVNTGITCAVKRLEVARAGSGEVVAAGYLVMPQTGDWDRFDLSSAVPTHFQAGQAYVLRVAEDEYCRNMSYLESNVWYTAAAGGGEASCNVVHFAALHLLYVAAH